MKKRLTTRALCLLVAGVMLFGALAVAAINGSPYDTLKRAAFNALLYDNVTMEGHFMLLVNGEVYEESHTHIARNQNSSLEMSEWGFSYENDGLRMASLFVDDQGVQWYQVNRSNWSRFNSTDFFNTGITAEDLDSARFRLMELLLDLVVGDLRNNLYMTTSDGIRRVSGAISHNQLPEILRVGIDVILEEQRASANRHNTMWVDGQLVDMGPRTAADFHHPLDAPMQSLTLTRASIDADIDAAGNLIRVYARGAVAITNIFGERNDIEIVVDVRFTDIGTSLPQSPIPGAAEIFSEAFFREQFGINHHRSLHFTRLPDGSINTASITPDWPQRFNTHTNWGWTTEDFVWEAYLSELFDGLDAEDEYYLEDIISQWRDLLEQQMTTLEYEQLP